MFRLLMFAIVAFFVISVARGTTSVLQNAGTGGAALLLQGISASEIESIVRDYYRSAILKHADALAPDKSSIEVQYADLNGDELQDMIAIVHSDETCGTSGCSVSIFIQRDLANFEPIPFEYSIKTIEVLNAQTMGMHDLKVSGAKTEHMVWNGTTYKAQ